MELATCMTLQSDPSAAQTRRSRRMCREPRRTIKRPVGQQLEPVGHEFVGDAHDLGELRGSRLADADIVSEALTHFLHAVGAAEDRHRDADLWLLAGVLLEPPADHKVEELLAAAE